jgi:nucleotide-binding universal stress UspA family protein
MTKPMRIFFATDFTDASTPAFHEAISMARQNGSELVIAHAYQIPSLGIAGTVSPDMYDVWDRRLREDAEARLRALADEAAKEGVQASPLVLFGDPYEVLVQAATDRAADLLIMGTHGRRGISRLFLGSVASRVISTAPCPVLTVRAA